MTKGLLTATVAVFLMLAAAPMALLFLAPNSGAVAASFAPCHQDVPDSGAPAAPNHDCCLIGHHHATPARAQNPPELPSIVLAQITPASPILTNLARSEPALTSFDPPSIQVPLRI